MVDNKQTTRPDASLYFNTPDPLSLLLNRLDLGAEVYVNGEFCGTWAVDTAGSRRIPFHLIGSGEAWLHHAEDDPSPLRERDVVMFPHDAHHIIANSQNRPESEIVNAPMSGDGEVTHMVLLHI